MTSNCSTDQPPLNSPRRWFSWILGIAVLIGVVVLAAHFSDEQAFVELARQAEPSWFLAAVVIQAATYLAQGEIWRIVGRSAGTNLPVHVVYKLALAKLFIDQALPSAGVSGTVVVAQVLERSALPRAAVLSGVVINTTSFFIAYAIALVAALAILFFSGHATPLIVLPSILFMIVSSGIAASILALSGKGIGRHSLWLLRNRVGRNAIRIMQAANPQTIRNIRLQVVASVYQLITFLLDALTLWVLIRSLGASTGAGDVFAGFMIANLARTVSFIPGGLGTFEAAAVLMLTTGGVSVAVGLSATLLFRGLTFFLPMLPGLWFSHRFTQSHRLPSEEPTLSGNSAHKNHDRPAFDDIFR